jgi:ureidoacrylate peracid hydrolase
METERNARVSVCPSKTALIVVDVQNDFCHEEGAFSCHKKIDVTHAHHAVSALLSFIQAMRSIRVPILFVQTVHSEWTDSPSWSRRLEGKAQEMQICAPGSWGSEFYRVTPEKTDCVVIKHRYSAFFETDLDLILRSRGIENLLITGLVTNVCVESTVRDAFNRNYNVVLIEDCCGAFDQAEHEAAIRNIGKYFGTVAHSETVSSMLKNQCGKGAPDETA